MDLQVLRLRVVDAAELLVPIAYGTFDGETIPPDADAPICFTAASVMRLYDALLQLEARQRGTNVTEEKRTRHNSTMDDLVSVR